MANMQWRTSAGVDNNPFRTRGAFDPNAPDNAVALNLPTLGDITICPSEGIAAYDSFTVVGSFTYGGGTLGAGSLTVSPGDRLAYMGGGAGIISNWVSIPESAIYGANVQIIAQRYGAFM